MNKKKILKIGARLIYIQALNIDLKKFIHGMALQLVPLETFIHV